MAEEQEEKDKPKATLIKQKKSAPVAEKKADDEIKPRKVVVVRKKGVPPKKKVVVKSDRAANIGPKTEPAETPPSARPAPASSDQPLRPQINPKTAGDFRPPSADRPDRGDQSHRRIYKKSEPGADRPYRPPGTDRGPAPRQGGGAPSSRPPLGRTGPGRPPLGRTGPGQSRPPIGRSGPGQSRPPMGRSGPGRPPLGRPGGPPNRGRPGGPTATGPPKPEATKTGGQRFVRSKKKPIGGYRREKEELDFQIKKRQNQPKANPIPKEIDMMEVITVSELARKMNVKASEVIGKLMGMGMMVTINQQIDAETATIVAGGYNCKVNIVSLYDETIIESEQDVKEEMKPRPPIVTIMGHVDHGKTKLLDAIRNTDVVAGEFGGITQHIGAHKVRIGDDDLVFLDTPGHEAFTLMRARGAQVTDMVILVVAADDGVMPQTVEAINHAKAADVPIIVAINKIDLPNANQERLKQQLSEHNLIPEGWGGTTLFCEISALEGTGVKELLDTIRLQADLMELKANYNVRADGRVIESKVDHGRGIVGTVLVQRGILKVGDTFVAGVYPGKVRAMFDDKGTRVDEATPATPVEILGFTGIPDAGAPFQVTESERSARQVGLKRQELEKQGQAKNVKKITLDNLYDSMQQGDKQELKVIIKGDVHGSVEALRTALEKLSTDDVALNVIHSSAGAIIENDVNLATASDAIIVGFHVRPTPKALELAEREKVEIRKYNIIYKAVEEIELAMEGMLAPEIHEEVIGRVEVRDLIRVPRIGVIAGSYVTSGKIRRNADVHIIREGVQIHTGKVTSLKRFKDDAREVESGFECGVGIDSYPEIQEGDELEVYELRQVAKKLN